MKISEIKKLFRFSKIYGLRRALFKAAGRVRIGNARLFSANFKVKKRNLAVIGCGQFSFATIGSLVEMYSPSRFGRSFDLDKKKQETLEKFYGVSKLTNDAEDICHDPEIEIVFVASNHASHTSYAIKLIDSCKTVYLEKPVAVTWRQFSELSEAIKLAKSRVYFGYNRPFSQAICDLKTYCNDVNGPITLSFFISGHVISADHWYRNPEEGTRVCGNMGHWLDLAVHVLSWKALPDNWKLHLVSSDLLVADDNCSVVMTSDRGDLITLVLTAREEPYEGINESINIQWGNVIAKIDDFRSMQLWKLDEHNKFAYWPKDVGHKKAILQPFENTVDRWQEVKNSTALMLKITEMIKAGQSFGEFSFSRELFKHKIV